MPIAQLFPQPAPGWVWSNVRETNFDRLAFYPSRAIRLPPSSNEEERRRLYCRLLDCWTKPPMNFLFAFASDVEQFRVVMHLGIEAAASDNNERASLDAERASHDVFQR